MKAYACDAKAALQQSVRSKWNGETDLGDGVVQNLRQEYEERMRSFNISGMGVNHVVIKQHICHAVASLGEDISFLANVLKKAEYVYQTKFNAPTTSQCMLKHLCWKTVEYNTFLQQAQALQSTLNNLLPYLDPTKPRVKDVIAFLTDMKNERNKYFRDLFVKKDNQLQRTSW